MALRIEFPVASLESGYAYADRIAGMILHIKEVDAKRESVKPVAVGAFKTDWNVRVTCASPERLVQIAQALYLEGMLD